MSKSNAIGNRGKSVLIDVDRHQKALTMDTDDRHIAAASPSTSVTPPGIESITASVRTTTKLSKFAYEPLHDSSAGSSKTSQSSLVNRTRSSQVNITNGATSPTPSHLNSCTSGGPIQSDQEAAAPNDALQMASTSISHMTSPSSRNNDFSDTESVTDLNNNVPGPSNERHEADDLLLSTSASALRPICTSKHFRIRNIIGRDSIDGDTYYVVAWKSSWVPSNLIKTSEDGQERCIEIDGKDWRVAGITKTKVKKNIHKVLVRWVDTTMEPIKRLRRALPAIREFEQMPRLNRRVVSFDESLIDQTKIINQSDEVFREAQVHLAKKWPWIEPRNDIDLMPALRQIFQEQFPRRDDEPASRKTHQRLIDQPQLRRLCWNEEYLLAGRYYECTLPKRNALLLQVVAQGVDDGCCERCVSDIAPFKECARDTAEDNPWLNGACANCGTAEANSTCCHHLVGTAHLERGRSKGLTSERLREFINPMRSIELLERLEYEQDDNSDTYSGDSYAESDNSSFWEPEGSDDGRHTSDDDERDGQHGESTINNLWTPDTSSGDEPASSHQHFAIGSDDGSGGLFISPAAQSLSPFAAYGSLRMQERSIAQGSSTFPTPDLATARGMPAVATSSRKLLLRVAAKGVETPSSFDRSSVTMAARSPALERQYDNISPNFPHDVTIGDSQLGDDNMYDNMDPSSAQEPTGRNTTTRHTVSPEFINTTDSRDAAIQTVEGFDQMHEIHASNTNAASSDGPQVPPRGRKRAASQPSEYEPTAFRSSTGSSRSSRGAFNNSEEDVEDPRATESSGNAVAKSSSVETKIDRGSIHEVCRANWPCRHPDHTTPDDGTFIIVYRDTIDDTSQLTIGEVQYILSVCTCHWASAFTKVWDGWCEDPDASVDVELTKPQYLLLYWTDRLLEAAKECCPTDPDNREIIIID
jgi:hypothetical protein